MSFEYVRADVLRNVQRRLIDRYGGLSGIRDDNALESAIARPANLEAYGGESSVGALAAALSWSILRNHPFSDGNKRAAFAAMVMFLDLNGFHLTVTEVELTGMVLLAAGSEIDEAGWTAWVERSIAAKA